MLEKLELELRRLSHSEEAIGAIRLFSDALKTSARRLDVFNTDRGLVQAPISSELAKQLGFDQPDDEFTLLQGDIISTESAFFLGERVTGNPKYVVLNSSCDLVPNRRQHAALLRIKELPIFDEQVQSKLNLRLKFKKADSMYLPALRSDRNDVVCNIAQFDGICQIRSEDLLLANRLASLSLVGWRIFASFSRVVIARANPQEEKLREAIEKQYNRFSDQAQQQNGPTIYPEREHSAGAATDPPE